MTNPLIRLKPAVGSLPRIGILVLGVAGVLVACMSPGGDIDKAHPVESVRAAGNDVSSTAVGSADGGIGAPPVADPISTPTGFVKGKGARVRPALTGDLTAFSRDDLVRDDYPMRPDRVKAPEAYQQWVDEVTRPITIVDVAPVREDRSNTILTRSGSLQNGDPWAATIMTAPQTGGVPLNRHFYQVYGSWVVPTVQANTSNTYSSLWVGLDGMQNLGGSLVDLPQMGTEQSVYPSGTIYYDFWVQVPPYDPCQWTWTGLTVHAGDTVSVGLFIGNSARQEDAWSGDYVWFYATNNTTGVSSGWIGDYLPAGTYNSACSGSPIPTRYLNSFSSNFTGQTAEAVLERPSHGNPPVKQQLAHVSTGSITGFYVDDYTYAWNNLTSIYGTAVYWQAEMRNTVTTDQLAWPDANTVGSTSTFTWYNYQ